MIPLFGILASAGLELIESFIEAGKDKAVELIKEKTGIDLNTKQTLTPADIARLKQFQERERAFLELMLQDRASAREMQKVALKQESWFAKNFVNLFALMWSLAAIAYIFIVTTMQIPQQSVRFADTILGFLLGTIIAGIIGFYYGSSLGSKIKDEVLTKKQ